MKKGALAILFLIIYSQTVFAQRVKLKQALSEKEFGKIQKSIASCFGFTAQFKISYSTTELFNDQVAAEKPASLEMIEELKKKLNGSKEDVNTLSDISGSYSKLSMPKEADEYREKVIELMKKIIERAPDSSNAHFYLAGIYMGGLRFEESIASFKKAYEVDTSNINPLIAICNLQYMTGHTAESVKMMEELYKAKPDSKELYMMMYMYYFYRYSSFLTSLKSTEELKLFTLDSALKMPMIDEYYAKHNKDKDAEFIYRVGKGIMLITHTTITVASDTAFDDEKIYFALDEHQKKLLEETIPYFETCLKGKNTSYRLFSNKILGGCYTLLNKPKKALPLFKKAIELKPISNSSATSNAAEDYNNVLVVYSILHDTAKYETQLLEKIRIKPAIEPEIDDYVNLARLYVSKNKLKEARIHYNKVLEMDAQNVDARLGVCLLEYMEGNPKKALELADKIYSLDKSRWELFLIYGAAMLQLNDLSNSYESFKIAKKMHDKKWIQEDFLDYFSEN